MEAQSETTGKASAVRLTLEQQIRSATNHLQALKKLRNKEERAKLLHEKMQTPSYAFAERIIKEGQPEIIKITKCMKYGLSSCMFINKETYDHVIMKANQPVDNFIDESQFDLNTMYSFVSE